MISSRELLVGIVVVVMSGVVASPAANAQDVARLPMSWVDASADVAELATLGDVAVERIDGDDVSIGYSFPLRDDVHVDCADDRHARRMTFGSDDVSIHFDRDEETLRGSCDDTVVLVIDIERDGRTAVSARMTTLQRAARRDRGEVVWGGVFAANESIDFLRGAVLGSSSDAATLSTTTPRVRDRLLAAIAVHDDPEASTIVRDALNLEQPSHLRESAVFWTAQLSGDSGASDLLDLARRDPDTGVRKQAIFWLAQLAGEAATRDLADIAATDADVEVRKSAVFALSQSEDDEAIDALIAIVNEHDSAEVVKSALFWLGQSGDERAIELFERLLFGGR